MWTINFIRAYINRIPANQVFSTRDCLCYGTRAAVDTALCRLVKKDIIFRLARGVFVRWSVLLLKGELPSAEEVAKTKARGFSKELYMHKRDAAVQLGLIEAGNEHPTFATFGRTTSFQYGQKRIRLAHAAPKDIKLGDSFLGLVIRGMRYFGNHDEVEKTVGNIMRASTKQEKLDAGFAAPLMSAWLSDLFSSDKVALLKIKGLTAQPSLDGA